MALQKNPGPLLTSLFKGLVEHIPPEWRARLGLRKYDQQEPIDVDPDTIADVLVNSEVNQTRTDERKKSNVELATDPTDVELHQQKRLTNGQLVDEVRTFVPEGTPLAGVSVETIEAEQHNLGIGWMTNDVTDAPLPGPTVESSEIDHDGVVVQVLKTRRLRSTITEGETLVGGIWTKITEEGETDLVATEVIRKRTIPGVPIITSRIDDTDGEVLEVVITYKPKTPDTSAEGITSSFWLKVHQAPCTSIMGESVLVVDEVIEGKHLPGNTLESAIVDGDQEIQNIDVVLRDESLITPVSSESGGFITTVEKKAVSDVVANQITTVTKWLDKAIYAQSIPDSIIPLEFRAQIPTVVESHVVAGIAVMPTLTGSQISTEQRQLTKNLKEVRTTSFGEDITFPIDQIGYELTEEFGGGVLEVKRRLHNILLTVDEGEDVVKSYVNPIGQALMWFRETARRYGVGAWPILTSRLWDENMRIEYDETKQVINSSGAFEDPAPVGVFGWVSEVKAIDKWRSLKVNTSKFPPTYVDEASALTSYAYKPFRFPGLLYRAPAGYYVRRADATLVQHLIKTWWEKTTITPVIAVDEIIMDDVVISSLNNTTTLDYSGMVLHDDLTTFGALFYPATTPSYTQYALGAPTGTTLQNIATLAFNGSGYSVGDHLTIASSGHSMAVDVTFVYDSGTVTGLIGATTVIDTSGTFPPGAYGPIASSGGGTGAAFFVTSLEAPTYTSGTQWIGTYKIIGASVTPEKEKDVWKIQTESVIMR